jgi:hypothetical protein
LEIRGLVRTITRRGESARRDMPPKGVVDCSKWAGGAPFSECDARRDAMERDKQRRGRMKSGADMVSGEMEQK